MSEQKSEQKEKRPVIIAARFSEEEEALIKSMAEEMRISGTPCTLSDLVREGTLALARTWKRKLQRSREINPPMEARKHGADTHD